MTRPHVFVNNFIEVECEYTLNGLSAEDCLAALKRLRVFADLRAYLLFMCEQHVPLSEDVLGFVMEIEYGTVKADPAMAFLKKTMRGITTFDNCRASRHAGFSMVR